MSDQSLPLSVQIVCELLFVNHLARDKLSKVLPSGMELSQFLVLLHIGQLGEETGPAKLAEAFNVTRGAMSNTLSRLERQGLITVRPDPLDARRKFIGLSDSGRQTLDGVFGGIRPAFDPILGEKETVELDTSLGVLSDLRAGLGPRG